jgi:hypothetical protein
VVSWISAMDRDEEMGHGDRSLLFVGDEDDDIGTYQDGGFMETSSDEGSFSDPSDGEARGGRRGGDGSKGAWPQSYRFVNQSPRRLALTLTCACTMVARAANAGRVAIIRN